MNRSMSMLLVLVSFRAAGAPPLCDKSSIKGARHPMVVVADKNPLHRAYLHSSVAEAAIADNPSKRYLIPGDFVFTTWSGAGSLPSSICVVYPNAQGKRTTGWIASSQLKELEAHATKLPRRASLTVATLPPPPISTREAPSPANEEKVRR